jgi:DNA-binding transcriptional LysR family regulator
MKLIRLQAFKTVFEARTVTEAAYRLKCSQPRVSRLLQELEEDIGFPLFLREKQRLKPTSEGRLFYEETERILLGIEDIDRIAEDIYNHREIILRVLSQAHLAYGLFNHVFGVFEKKYKGVRYYLEIRALEQLAKWLGGHQFDLAMVPLPAKHPLARHEFLMSTRLLVAIPKNHPLSNEKQITVKELAKGPIISLTKGKIMRQRQDSLIQEAALKPNIRVETPTILSACQLVSQGLGITLTDPFIANIFNKSELVVRPLVPDYQVDYGVLYLRQNPPRQLARAFIETTKEVAFNIAKNVDQSYYSDSKN